MNGRHSSNRASDGPTDGSTDSADDATDSVDDCTPPGSPTISETHCREWRRWLVEDIASGTASVVPLASLVDTIIAREDDTISRAAVQDVLADQILPTLEREPGVEYDVDRQLVINYGH